jgi:hypothetical protein
VPIVAAMPVGFPEMASSSQTVPLSEPEVNYSQIMEALAAIQGGDEQYTGVHVLHAARSAFHQPASRAEPAGPSGVPEVSSS